MKCCYVSYGIEQGLGSVLRIGENTDVPLSVAPPHNAVSSILTIFTWTGSPQIKKQNNQQAENYYKQELRGKLQIY